MYTPWRNLQKEVLTLNGPGSFPRRFTLLQGSGELSHYVLLLYIRHSDDGSIGCDIVFKKGHIHLQGLPFLHFCKK